MTRPSGSTTCWTKVGLISFPLLAIVAATSAICVTVASICPSSPPWPIATRAMSKPESTCLKPPPLPAGTKIPLAAFWSSGSWTSGSLPKPKRSMYSSRVSAPTSSPSWAK